MISIVDGTQSVTITASADTFINGTAGIDVADDDVPTLTLLIDVGSINENGGTATGTVHRNTDTTEALMVDLSSSDLGEATVPASVTIPAGSDSATFTITGVDDSIVDGTQSVNITASADTFINGTSGIDVADSNFHGIVVSHTDSATTIFESRLADEFSVVLGVAPQGDVVIDLASSDVGQLTTEPSSLTFTTSDWNVPQTVRVVGVDDGVLDAPAQQMIVLSVNPGASDPNYHAVAEQVDVTIIDQDFSPLTVTVVEGVLVYVDSQGNTTLLDQSILQTTHVINTGALNDTIPLSDAPDGVTFLINSQAGDDVIVLASLAANVVNGGAGFDRLEIESVEGLDWMRSIGQLQFIEEIVLHGVGITNFEIDSDAVGLISSESKHLVVHMGDLPNFRMNGSWLPTSTTIVDQKVHHVATSSGATLELVNENAWQNPFEPYDVNRSGNVSPLDALVILNFLNSQGLKIRQPTDPLELLPYYYDSNGDNRVVPLDALVVLNHLNRQSSQFSGEAPQDPLAAMAGTLPTKKSVHDDDEIMELLAYEHLRIGAGKPS
ncbi:MAG: dockerin type I domain-containing protein [Pirellulaceae bacterium]